VSTDSPDPFEHEDAAYVLGALGHEDRIAYEDHLRSCDRCSAAVAELAVLPGLLSRLPHLPASAEETVPPPDTLLPGLLARMRRSRRRRRGWAATAGVAVAAGLVAGTVAVTGQTGQTGPPPDAAGVPVRLSEVGDVPVQAELRLEAVGWGTRISMTCRYDGPASSEDYAQAGTYQLVVVPADALAAQRVAQWQALPGRDARVTGSTDLTVDEIAEVQLLDGNGTVLLQGSPP